MRRSVSLIDDGYIIWTPFLLGRFLWLRRFIRNNTAPIPENRAALWKSRLSLVYMLVSWNAFGLVAYMCYKGKSDWAKYYGLKTEEELRTSPGHQWAKTLGIDNAAVYKLSGFKFEKVDKETTKAEDAV
ncbi:hypothetical protein JTB14_031638 [Gonioctena quinquepunctata]|nr:hypothetical protein JTB14_031638 [Gonioctena quinquepunctata]